jgi:hypothetical protein
MGQPVFKMQKGILQVAIKIINVIGASLKGAKKIDLINKGAGSQFYTNID